MLELAAHPNIAGVKQAVAALDADTLELLAEAPDGFSVLGGEDTILFPLMCMGGAGTICASAHVCTERFVAMIECGLAGKVDDGRAHAEALLPVVQAGFAEPNPAVFKGVLHAQGRIPTPDRAALADCVDASGVVAAVDARRCRRIAARVLTGRRHRSATRHGESTRLRLRDRPGVPTRGGAARRPACEGPRHELSRARAGARVPSGAGGSSPCSASACS